MVNVGARLVRDAGQADTVVVGRRALEACLSPDGRLQLPFTRHPASSLLSEAAFARRLAGEPADQAAGPYLLEEIGRLAALPVDTCAALALFDVVGEGQQRFGYPDLSAARQVATLMAEKVPLPAIIRAVWALQRRGSRLSQVRLAAAPWGGEVVESVAGRLVRLDGQYALVLDETRRDAAACFAAAAESEGEGDAASAELWYRRAIVADPGDALASFNLGNVLVSVGRAAEATIAFQQALARDPTFAEAAFNIAALAEHSEPERAMPLYRQVIAAHPAYIQPLYNLARLLTVREAYAEALPLWERFIGLAPDDADAKHARRAVLLCRLARRKGGPSARATHPA